MMSGRIGVTTTTDATLKPPVSKARVRVCGPAASVAVQLRSCQVCVLPVIGTLRDAVATEPTLTCILPVVVAEATFAVMVYWPAAATFTLYATHSPSAIQLMSGVPRLL